MRGACFAMHDTIKPNQLAVWPARSTIRGGRIRPCTLVYTVSINVRASLDVFKNDNRKTRVQDTSNVNTGSN
jgi:hypothetical protein